MKKVISSIILKYFRSLAIRQLKKNPDATLIGVTGSAGKTSLRLAILQILKTHGSVKHTAHANSESGIPLNILGLSPTDYSPLDWLRLIFMAPVKLLTNNEHFKYFVVEMGIDSPKPPKNMSYLLRIIRPDVGVVLNANLTHSAGFDYLVRDTNPKRRVEKLIKAIAKEKMMLVKGIGAKGVAVVNIDQKELAHELKDVSARKITFGKSAKADLRIVSCTVERTGFHMTFKYQGQKHELRLQDIFSPAYAYTFAAAIATAAAVGIPPSISLSSLSSYRAPLGRMRLFEGINDSTIIDSSYNASPQTMTEALQLLKNLGGRNKKIAVIGDMRELGLSEKIAHKNLADSLLLNCSEAILYGELTKEYVLPVLIAKKFPVHHFDHMSDLVNYLRSTITPKSFVLVKGSQNTIYLERAVESILKNASDVAKLCRRGSYWDKLRNKAV